MFLPSALRPKADYFANPSINPDWRDKAAPAGYVNPSINPDASDKAAGAGYVKR